MHLNVPNATKVKSQVKAMRALEHLESFIRQLIILTELFATLFVKPGEIASIP